eukprot:CAMPEP_0185189078 /NCGR_PEP_ID=MMETSP1140-20130426/5809_1 /TAXON_ID=298111 /ORGANISM="Pavlova sp., Strain CCMP459" /LENGTH=102 /DNA_ID=CAMNT_0027755609 /DNA_START=380 /DNA_END=685 /DNA_ORIENTATION=-
MRRRGSTQAGDSTPPQRRRRGQSTSGPQQSRLPGRGMAAKAAEGEGEGTAEEGRDVGATAVVATGATAAVPAGALAVVMAAMGAGMVLCAGEEADSAVRKAG